MVRMHTPDTVTGHIYFRGSVVGRYQDKKPAGRCTLTCYRHPGCNLLTNPTRKPTVVEFTKYLFEVPAVDPGASKADEKRLTEMHVGLGKSRWSAKV